MLSHPSSWPPCTLAREARQTSGPSADCLLVDSIIATPSGRLSKHAPVPLRRLCPSCYMNGTSHCSFIWTARMELGLARPPAGRSASMTRSAASSTPASTRRTPMVDVSVTSRLAVVESGTFAGSLERTAGHRFGLTMPRCVCSAGNLHHTYPCNRILEPSRSSSPTRSSNSQLGKAASHHHRRPKIRSRTHAQVQREPQWHLLHRQDLEP
jgi:hypothetical protein